MNIEGFEFKTRNDWDKWIVQDEFTDVYRVRGKKYKTAIDIGAHIGGTTIMLASQGTKVYAIEPEKGSYDLLVENLKLNNLTANTFNNAIGKENTAVNLFVNQVNYGCSSVNSFTTNIKHSVSKVDTIRLQDILDKMDYCDFIKCDCEGFEYDIFLNLPDEYFSKIGNISMELHFDWSKQEKLINKLKQYFSVEVLNNTQTNGDRLIFCKK